MRAVVLVVLAACGGGGAAVDGAVAAVDAPAVDADSCPLPVPAAACDPDAMPLPNPSCLVEEPGDGGCPPGMVRIDAFCIDRFEASIDGASPFWNPGATPGPATSRRDAVPQAYISGAQAAASCAAAGKRLCTDAE